MAEYLGQSQANISLLENGQAESGPVRRLLDALEALIADGARQTQPLPDAEGAEPQPRPAVSSGAL